MIVNRPKALMRISILLNILHGTIQATAIDVKLSNSLKRRDLEKESLLHLVDQGKEISSYDSPSHTEKFQPSDSSQIRDQVDKVNRQLKAVTISAGGEEEDPAKTSTTKDKNAKDIVLGSASIEHRGVSNEAVNDEKLTHKQQESGLFSSSKDLVYKYDKETPTPNLEAFNEHGFYKSTCFKDPDADGESEEYCIFINPTTNRGQGLVIVTTEKNLKGFFENGLKIADEPTNADTFKIEDIPGKGGLRAVATHKLEMGDYVQVLCPVALFQWTEDFWQIPFVESIFRQAIDHLPHQTRAAIAHLPGKGQTEDEFILSVTLANVHKNCINNGDTKVNLGGVYLKKYGFNNSCRPNTQWYTDPVTQLLHMRAYEPIEIGQELTTTYCSSFLDRAERRKILQEGFGVDCTCSHCLMSEELGKISDQNLFRIRELLYLFKHNDPNLSVSELEELLNVTEKENIPLDIVESNIIAAKFFNFKHEILKVKEHAEKAKLYMKFIEPQKSHLADLDMLLSNPEKHRSHFSFNGLQGKEHGLFPSSENLMSKYDTETITPQLKLLDHGFYKSTCFKNPNPSEEPNEYCILINPTINNNQGCVIVTPTKYLEGFFQEHLKMSDNPPDYDAVNIVPMPEKGGMGAVAAQRFSAGDCIQKLTPVGLFPLEEPIWETPFGRNIRRQAVDHLPLQTRDVISLLSGRGRTKNELISSIIGRNGYQSWHTVGDGLIKFTGLYPKASRFNHSCRPNAAYYIDHTTHLFHIKAFKPIEMGEEITISYWFQESDQAARQKHLKDHYGFDCTCSHCMMGAEHGKKSDDQIARLIKLNQLSRESNLSLSEIEEFVTLSEEEAIPKFITRAHVNAAKFYNSNKEMDKVKEHAEKAKVMGEVDGEFKASPDDVHDLETLLSEPKKHSSYDS
ncbi:hypothetical protein PGT21_002521 [Puccinia graminis f. sp. tritici]|uniref:SET domain-containing protein n=1 Tax=Puccinia graminis f. sp. tritici TaxID=56615 RepID=A0A5B0RPG1_PUCGR|nr:hypothetical protein PGT21_002521 [Puccinia graminis f. sp. tritici]KAA1127881.1 hypothetical protein PGTUg99_002523 [Puccinia graminis f. sp. tritici]